MADVSYFNNIDLQSTFKVKNSIDPSSPQDLVTLNYLESYVAGVRDPKEAVKLASTANVPLTGGATLTIDTISVANGDSILLKNQTTASENGIYVASGIGGTYSLARRADANSDAEVTSGMYTFVTEGSVNLRTGWLLTTPDPIVVDTTSLSFSQIYGASPLIPGAAIDIAGNQVDVKTDGTSIDINGSNELQIDAAYPGQTSIVTVGTIATGVWNGTAIAIADGGTGASTASGARSNLSAAQSGSNSDITELTGLTTALSVGQGGTGATTAAGARSNLGATGKFTTTTTAGNASYNITHNLGTEDIVVQIWESVSKKRVEGVYAEIQSSNAVQIQFGVTTSLAYKIVVIG